MNISTIRGLGRCIRNYSEFSGRTVNSIIIALGFHPLHSKPNEFRELSNMLKACTDNESSEGYKRLFNYNEAVPFFLNHRKDIVYHMERKARENKMDVISMVQKHIFSRRRKPTTAVIGKALWFSDYFLQELNPLYNYFIRYVLCEMSWAWYRYLEEIGEIQL